MHENANIAFQLQETITIYETVLGLQPKVGGSKGEGEKSPEEIVDDYAATFEEQVKFLCPSPERMCHTHMRTDLERNVQMPDVLDRYNASPDMFKVMPNGAFRFTSNHPPVSSFSSTEKY